MVAQQAAPPPLTWNAAAKFRQQQVGRIIWDGGLNAPQRLTLRNAGYLDYLVLTQNITGQYVTTGPTSVDAFGQFSGPLNRITVRVNSVGDLFDCSGYMTAINSAIDSQFRYGAGTMTPTPPYAFTAAPATAVFNDQWAMNVPFGLYLANKPFPYGLVQLALNSMECVIEVRWNPIAVAQQAGVAAPIPGTGVYGGNAANLTAQLPAGFVDVGQAYYDPIADLSAQPPLGYIARWREMQTGVGADGDFDFKLPASNIYTRMIAQYVQGAATALAPNGWVSPAAPGVITRVQLRYGGNLAPYDYTAAQIQERMTRRYNFTLPVGCYILDFLEDSHTERDLIDSAATTDLRLTFTLAGGNYAAGAYIRLAVQELVPIRTVPSGGATAQGVAG